MGRSLLIVNFELLIINDLTKLDFALGSSGLAVRSLFFYK